MMSPVVNTIQSLGHRPILWTSNSLDDQSYDVKRPLSTTDTNNMGTVADSLDEGTQSSIESVEESVSGLKIDVVSKSLDEAADEPVLPSRKLWCEFNHKEGGTLQKRGSDVILTVPPGAVPYGKTYDIQGDIHIDLNKYNKWMINDQECIISPVPEYVIKDGRDFDKPVEIKMPHCLGKGTNVRVLHGSGNDFKEVSKDDNITYELLGDFIHIYTRHFTEFIVCGQIREISDALLTVAASKSNTPDKTVTQLRLMLHTNCAGQNDFSLMRKQFYDPNMEEIRRLKVTLPDTDTAIELPDIHVRLTPDNPNVWKVNTGDGLQQVETIKVIGRDVLKVSPNHRSENLANFILENRENQDPACGMLTVTFDNGEGKIPEANIHVVYPEGSHQKRRKISVIDPLKEAFKVIAKDLGEDFGSLAINLDITKQDRDRLTSQYPEPFQKNFELLTKWKQAQGENATIEALVSALEKCGRNDLAQEAKVEYESVKKGCAD